MDINNELENKRLELEKIKLELELQKLQMERDQMNNSKQEKDENTTIPHNEAKANKISQPQVEADPTQKPKLNIVALLCVLVMMISCFLPWAEVSSSSSYMGYSSSYHSSVSGVQAGVGVIPLLISLVCGILVFTKSRFMIIPGLMILGFSLLQTLGMQAVSSNVVTSFGSGHSGTGIGVYVLLISSLLYVSFTIKNLRKPKVVLAHQSLSSDIGKVSDTKPQVKFTNEVPVSSTISQPRQVVPEIPTPKVDIVQPQESQKSLHESKIAPSDNPIKPAAKLSRFNKALIIIGIIIGVYVLIFMWADSSSSKYTAEREQAEKLEKSRIEQVISKVNELAEAGKFDDALLQANSIGWMHEPSVYDEFVKIYDQQRENLKADISKMKSQQDSILQAEIQRKASETSAIASTMSLVSSANNTFISPEQIIRNDVAAAAIQNIIQRNDQEYEIKYLEDDNRYYLVTRKLTAESYTYSVITKSIERYSYYLRSGIDYIERNLISHGFSRVSGNSNTYNYYNGCFLAVVILEENVLTVEYSYECD